MIRSKSNTDLRRLYSNPVDKDSGVRCDQIVTPGGFYTHQSYPERLRRIKFYDAQRDNRLTFLTDQFTLPAATIADLCCCRWQVELFKVDQAAPPNQDVLRNERKRGKDLNLDRRCGLCAGGDR